MGRRARLQRGELLMSGSIASTPTNIFPALIPEKLHKCGRAFGLLSSIQPDEDCQIARIITRTDERLIVLPLDLDLSSYVGLRIGLTLIDGKILCRRLSA
jgi:hypothetical protein